MELTRRDMLKGGAAALGAFAAGSIALIGCSAGKPSATSAEAEPKDAATSGSSHRWEVKPPAIEGDQIVP